MCLRIHAASIDALWETVLPIAAVPSILAASYSSVHFLLITRHWVCFPVWLQPSEVLSCPFRADLASNPGDAVVVTGFVQTSNSRKSSENSPPPSVSFKNCGARDNSGNTCTVRDVGKCVSVTDGSRIVNRYQDKSGAASAGPVQVSQSQLFAVNNAVSSTLGPPRVEPTLPDSGPAIDPAPTSTYVQPTADESWWNRRRRALLDVTGPGRCVCLAVVVFAVPLAP